MDLISDLSIIERCNPDEVINMLYGAFDGFDYSEQIVQDKLIGQLANGGNTYLVKEILDVAEIIKSYPKIRVIMTLDQIIARAKVSDAVQFNKFLKDNSISNTWLDVCITNYNEDYFNITLDDYEDFNIMFVDGVYES
jgi:hypothetical protein